jgi:hypothetical protein
LFKVAKRWHKNVKFIQKRRNLFFLTSHRGEKKQSEGDMNKLSSKQSTSLWEIQEKGSFALHRMNHIKSINKDLQLHLL